MSLTQENCLLNISTFLSWKNADPPHAEPSSYGTPQQCEIPEDFKLPLTPQSLDVMSFLGIQRAKPLARKEVSRRRRVDRTDDDWE